MERKTDIKDIPVVNAEISREVARLNKTTVGDVEDIWTAVGEFIAATIRKGTMEAVMLPGLGKFQPRKEYLFNLKVRRQAKIDGTMPVYLALKRKK